MADPSGISPTPSGSGGSTSITPTSPSAPSSEGPETPSFQPHVPDHANLPEFTWQAIIVGAVLGIIFGASSLYLVLKVGLTVSASVPIAVLSITLFRAFSTSFGFRRATILENNIVQTAGSAGESIAFGVGVTMPALLLLGFEMDWTRVMTVSVLGGLLGILMMIPLRRAFIVKQHGKLAYPEGTACAEVLVAGEKGGATARMVFVGFGIALVYKFFTAANKLWSSEPAMKLYGQAATGTKLGLKGAEVGGELSPELMGVGYLIGPRIASLMVAGAVLSYFIIGPMIATFGENLHHPILPAESRITIVSDDMVGKKGDVIFGGEHPGDVNGVWRVASLVGAVGLPGGAGPAAAGAVVHTRIEDKGLIRNMEPGELRGNYLRYIGAGAVAAGGIIGMIRAMPLILASIFAGLRDLRASRIGGAEATRRTERDLSMYVVLFGSLGLVLGLMLVPSLGLGLSPTGLLGAMMILLFGFLFVTVSSRLTGEVGSSSNPISGMTIATLLLTCVIFVLVGRTVKNDPKIVLTALMIAAVVCIASSNGGTTSQDLKTGYLVGATPRKQQWAILVGAITSALVIGVTMLLLNSAGTWYTTVGVPNRIVKLPDNPMAEKVGKPYASQDATEYFVIHILKNEYPGIKPGRYLVDAEGRLKYLTVVPISPEAQELKKMDNGDDPPKPFTAPQPQLFASITQGILGGTLEWSLVVLGALIAVSVELAGVSALPFAVGMYIPLSSSAPIFIGGLLRWLTDRLRGKSASDVETETSPGVLLSSGYIAGGTLCGLIIAFFAFLPADFNNALNLGRFFGEDWENASTAKIVSLAAFLVLGVILAVIGSRKATPPSGH
jgi:uncharacterized oligopeptide transporter (OPT) family protein